MQIGLLALITNPFKFVFLFDQRSGIGMKYVFKNQDLQMFGRKLNKSV